MIRKRIQTQPEKVISTRGRIVFSRESQEQRERALIYTKYLRRRNTFMEQRNKLDVVEVVTLELVSFNNGVAESINQFRKNRN